MRNKGRSIYLGVALIVGVALAPGAALAAKKLLALGTSTTGGSWYPTGVLLAQLWNEKIPEIKVTANVTKGAVQNCDLARKGQMDLVYQQSNTVRNCYAGTGPYRIPQKDTRILATLFPSHYHWLVTKRSGINKISDIKGKRFIPGRKRSGNISVTKAILGTLGMNFKDFEADWIAPREAIQAVRDGKVDGTFVLGGAPVGALAEALTVAGGRLKLLSYPSDLVQAVTKKHPWIVAGTIRGGLYKGYDQDMVSLMHISFLTAKDTFDADLAYQITKVTWENIERLRGGHKTFKNMDVKNMKFAFSMPIPMHEGALRYYKEIGMK